MCAGDHKHFNKILGWATHSGGKVVQPGGFLTELDLNGASLGQFIFESGQIRTFQIKTHVMSGSSLWKINLFSLTHPEYNVIHFKYP